MVMVGIVANGLVSVVHWPAMGAHYLPSLSGDVPALPVDMEPFAWLYGRLLRCRVSVGGTYCLFSRLCAMKKVILITGGQRSGKSTKAETLALSLSTNPVYVATAKVWDEEFRERVRRHQERRGPEWTNIEEELYLSRHDLTGRVVVVDCVTLWLTNFFFSHDEENDIDWFTFSKSDSV